MILVNQKLSRVLYQVVLTLNRVVLSRLLGHFQVSGTFHPRLHAKIITTTVIFLPYRRHLAWKCVYIPLKNTALLADAERPHF